MEQLSYALSILASALSIISIIWVNSISKKVNISYKQDRRLKNKGDGNVMNSGDNNRF